MTHDIQDDGFHEIQLNGKQLVFLFMAATVVSVVIFLCGVLVGRGVRTERALADSPPAASIAEVTPQPQPAAQAVPPPAALDPTKAQAPAPSGEDLSFLNGAEKQNPRPEAPKAKAQTQPPTPVEEKPIGRHQEKAAEKPVEKAPARPIEKPSEKPAATTAMNASAPAAVDANPSAADPSGQGYAVQIAALNIRSEADAIAKRLSSKGYSAYVLAPANGTPSVFRVRVGKFPTRREAESVAAKLQKEEQFKPWVTR